MLKQLFSTMFLVLPFFLMSQDDNPFDTGGGNDNPFDTGGSSGNNNPTDPFSDPEPTPDTTPIDNPSPSNDNPFDTGNSDGDDNPFDTGSDNGLDTSLGGGNPAAPVASGGGSVFDKMVDTLQPPLVPDFPWEQKSIQERPVLAYDYLRESDVFWAKTVWREIDIREKMNHPFVFPRAPFMSVLSDILRKNPDLPVYGSDPFSGRDFTEVVNWDSIKLELGNTRIEESFYEDENGEIQSEEVQVSDPFRPGKVKRFAIREVWYFDKKSSTMKVQIMGIAPLYETSASDIGASAVAIQSLGLQNATSFSPLFWIYYPDVREHLARYETINPLNDAMRMSWDDLFTSRFFSSYITKVSNPLDERIKDYKTNKLDALYESEKIKEDIFNFEHDLWSY